MMEIQAGSKAVIFRFDGFEVDPSGFRLSNDGVPVDLEPKALHLLIYLLQNPGRLLKKQELLDGVWGDSAVTENALTRTIAILRRVLKDTTKAAKYIETVPTQGYRFVAEVSTATPEERRSPHVQAAITDAGPTVTVGARHRSFRNGMIAAGILGVLVLSVLSYRALRDGHSAENRDGELKRFRLVQVTFSGGLDGFPGFSPDGRSIVFSSDRNGAFDLYVRQLGENGGELQLTRDGGGNIQPAWSPDGQMVAYHSLKNGGVWVIPVLGGTPRRVTDFGSQPSWCRDGTQIAFQSGDVGSIGQVSTAMPGATIWTVNVSGSGLRQVTKLSSTPLSGAIYGDASPRWFPGNRRILYENSGALWTIGADGSDPRSVGADRFAYDPALSKDGHTLYFLSQDSEGSGLWKLALDREFRASGGSVKLHNSAPASAQHLDYAAGDRFVFSIMSTMDNLYSISISPAGTVTEPTALTQDTRLRKTRPLFSPDGSQISFLVVQRGRSGQLWVVRPDGKDPKQIPIGGPAFDSEWCGADALCYWSYRSWGGATLSRWDMERGKASELLQTSARVSATRLSPDASMAAYQRVDDGAMNVWLLSLRTGESKQLTANPGVTGWPAWSPDGRSLAVEIRDGPNTQIGIVPASGGKLAYLTHDPGQNWPYSWSPDGKQIAFAGSRGGIWNLYSVAKDSGAIRKLTHYTTPGSFVRYPEWSPSGKQIVYEYGTSTANIWLLEPRK